MNQERRQLMFGLPLMVAAVPVVFAEKASAQPALSPAVVRAAEEGALNLHAQLRLRRVTSADLRQAGYSFGTLVEHLIETGADAGIDAYVKAGGFTMTVERAGQLRALVSQAGGVLDDAHFAQLLKPLPSEALADLTAHGFAFHGRRLAKFWLAFATALDQDRGGFLARSLSHADGLTPAAFWTDGYFSVTTCFYINAASIYGGVAALAAGPAGPAIGLGSLVLGGVGFFFCAS